MRMGSLPPRIPLQLSVLNVRTVFKDQFRTAKGLIGSHGERGAQAYNGDLGWSPQRASGSRAPGGGQGGKPPEAECLFHFFCPNEAANLPHD